MENCQSTQEPIPKKLKMSTSDDEDREPTTADGDPTAERKPKYKRRKVAIFFAYCGIGYQGMQKNPGAKTIEGDLEEALFFSGAIPEQDRGHPKRLDWARSARTDKGVSAVGQVVSGRFYVDPPGLIQRLNSNLPPQFRIFGYKRVTPSFSAKKFCDRRRYVYLIPVFALDPSAHRDRESVLASLGSESELVKCLECSERGRKVAGIMGKRSFESRDSPQEQVTESLESGISLNNGGNSVTSNSALVEELVNSIPPNENPALHSELVNEVEGESHTGVRGDGSPKDGGFCYGDGEKERFNRILKLYEGTHNFYNFTTRIKREDPSAIRYVISVQANTTVTVRGIEFVKCEIVGQSFMLHQIRKMIGVAVAIMRNCAPESFIETALKQSVSITVPTAPEVGLYLDECFFTSYNKKWKDTHEEVSMEAYAEEAEDFKLKHIYTHIASTEHKEGAVAVWLHSLNHRNYPDLRIVDNKGTADLLSPQVQEKADHLVTPEGMEVDQLVTPEGVEANQLVTAGVEKADQHATDEVKEKADQHATDEVKEKADQHATDEVQEKADQVVTTEVEKKADQVVTTEVEEKADLASAKVEEKADLASAKVEEKAGLASAKDEDNAD